jgi:hypothetical protein
MGKSSLRVRNMNKLRQEGVICASIDLGRLGRSATPEVWFADVVSELRRSFELATTAHDDRSWRQQHDSLSPVLRLGRFIEDELLVQFDDRNIVIFFDEIDSLRLAGLVSNQTRTKLIDPSANWNRLILFN